MIFCQVVSCGNTDDPRPDNGNVTGYLVQDPNFLAAYPHPTCYVPCTAVTPPIKSTNECHLWVK